MKSNVTGILVATLGYVIQVEWTLVCIGLPRVAKTSAVITATVALNGGFRASL
jgi:hypothetical protein